MGFGPPVDHVERFMCGRSDPVAEILQIDKVKAVVGIPESDVALVLHPLPRVPMLICYWHAEDGMASDLNLFFGGVHTVSEHHGHFDGAGDMRRGGVARLPD